MRRRESLEAARVFIAGGAGATWEVTQEVTSREKLESVNKTGDRGWGRAAYTKQEAAQGWQSLVGCRLWGRTESDTTEATEQ